MAWGAMRRCHRGQIGCSFVASSRLAAGPVVPRGSRASLRAASHGGGSRGRMLVGYSSSEGEKEDAPNEEESDDSSDDPKPKGLRTEGWPQGRAAHR